MSLPTICLCIFIKFLWLNFWLQIILFIFLYETVYLFFFFCFCCCWFVLLFLVLYKNRVKNNYFYMYVSYLSQFQHAVISITIGFQFDLIIITNIQTYKETKREGNWEWKEMEMIWCFIEKTEKNKKRKISDRFLIKNGN